MAYILLTEGRNERVYKSSNGENVSHENTISLNELIRYIELTDSNEIWPEHSLSIEEQKGVGD